LISMDSTLRSNLSVGLPLDVMLYPVDSLHADKQYRITESHPHYVAIRKTWSESLVNSFMQLPPLDLGKLTQHD
jgi:putative proteasome-type protease